MTDGLAVAQRLDEGRPAVDHTRRYLRACQQLGYQDPVLAKGFDPIGDRYDSEDGLDLYLLDGDCARLRAAGATVAEALGMQRGQVGALAMAWAGPGADAAVNFLQRHVEAGQRIVAEVRAAALGCESLREDLWRLVDMKVESVIAIDDRTLARRPAWLAACAEVGAGAAPGSAAAELVRHQINPYLDNDIRDDWLGAMRAATAGIGAAYTTLADRLTSSVPVSFDHPDDLGSGPQSPPVPSALAAIAPAAATSAPAPDPEPAFAASPAVPAGIAPAPGAGLELPTDAGDFGALGDFGGPGGLGAAGTGGLGGLAGLAGRIVDALAELLGTAAVPIADPLGSVDPADGGDRSGAEAVDDVGDENPSEPRKPDAATETGASDEKSDNGEAPEAADGSPPGALAGDGAERSAMPIGEQARTPVPEGAATPVAQPPRVPEAPPHGGSAPAGEASSPCEIAADELPKAGP
ncbi:hypothetical protein TM48_02026 [Mycobacterium shottsii]|uniref:Uncharacterized protein n=1 Tax=Mycobacterium shottsii TaxID=133549 RepID=A0A7I7LE63_9MYCO|nr:hypothetical protein [Mycobacterium shottsii]QYL27771.1 hypothetical protein TM48_02026 [Mycobacterium shottsii]BBX57593.1 hypothetical protein MSHO_29380 [Mycobacterium shottsii]